MEGNKRIVITYGTFDLFHQGHYNILKRARELGDFLIVGVTGENYDRERGKLSVKDSMVKRIESVKKTGLADKIIIEEYLGQKIQDIIKYNVDVLVVGSDWAGQFDHLRRFCEVVYLERTKNISSTMLRNEGTVLKLGIVTDDLEDHHAVVESKFVSGIHAESVYAASDETGKLFCEKYELNSFYDDYDEFLNNNDIIFVKTEGDSKYEYIKTALEKGKNVISTPMLSNDPEDVDRLYSLASDSQVVLLESICTLYLEAFAQLLWNVRGNLLGDIGCVKCGIAFGGLSGIPFNDIRKHIYFALICAIKLIDKADFSIQRQQYGDGKQYILLTGKSEAGFFQCEIGDPDAVSTSMEIIGSRGIIHIPEDWWNTCYFSMKDTISSEIKHYSKNFDGNGLRYIFADFISKTESIYSKDLRLMPHDVIYALNCLDTLEII